MSPGTVRRYCNGGDGLNGSQQPFCARILWTCGSNLEPWTYPTHWTRRTFLDA